MPPRAAEISAAVAAILADLDADIAARHPRCDASGRCCHFETYGHRLYLTAAELLHFAHVHLPKHETPAPAAAPPKPTAVALPQFFAAETVAGCPYQIDNLCTAREARPLGCRIYFCDPAAQEWQNTLYEKYHAQLKALHHRFALPYRYLEWREGLRELAAGDMMPPSRPTSEEPPSALPASSSFPS